MSGMPGDARDARVDVDPRPESAELGDAELSTQTTRLCCVAFGAASEATYELEQGSAVYFCLLP
jgi:hypothetical protein